MVQWSFTFQRADFRTVITAPLEQRSVVNLRNWKMALGRLGFLTKDKYRWTDLHLVRVVFPGIALIYKGTSALRTRHRSSRFNPIFFPVLFCYLVLQALT